MTESIKISDTKCQYVTLESLFQAYFDCRRNKRYTLNALAFETMMKIIWSLYVMSLIAAIIRRVAQSHS